MMGDVIDRDLAFAFSLNQLSRVTGSTYRTVTRRLEAAAVQPAGIRNGHPVYPLREAMPAILFPRAGLTAELDDCPEARRTWYQSENERLKFEDQAGQLIPREEVATSMHFLEVTTCSFLSQMTSELATKVGLSEDAKQLVQEVVDGLLLTVREKAGAFDGPARR